jgi:putative DNA primase/helicase
MNDDPRRDHDPQTNSSDIPPNRNDDADTGSDLDSRTMHVTFFKDFAADTLITKEMTLPALRDLILRTKAKTKDKLPWLKLARFGDKLQPPEPGGKQSRCLRWDGNLTGIDGIELDYDGLIISLDEAVAALKGMNLRGIIYTTPSYSEKTRKWRYLLPVSCPQPPEMRAKLVARVNGRLGNIFSGETFTLSQSYYFGRAEDNAAPDHQAVILGGRFIDQADDLKQFEARGMLRLVEGNKKDDWPHGFEAIMALLGDGEGLRGFNDVLIRASSSYAATHGVNLDRDALKEMLKEAIKAAPKKPGRPNKENKKYLSNRYLDKLIRSAIEKFGENYHPDILDPANPLRSARHFMAATSINKDGLRTMHRHRGAFWWWAGNHYRLVDEEMIKAEIWTFLEKMRRMTDFGPAPFKPTRARVGDILEALGAICQLDKDINPPAWLTPNHAGRPAANELFACGNGLLHLPTGTLYPRTPDYFNLAASDVVYDPNAPEPVQWLAFLNQLFERLPPDQDSMMTDEPPVDEQSIELLQEWFGYSLSTDTSQQKILLIVGPKRSGKGTSMRILRMLLGPGSVAGPTIASLSEQFGLEPLIPKTMAIISDARIGSKTNKATVVERLLSISGEDPMTVPRKYRDAWHGQLMTRISILSNELPGLSDGSGALAGRFLVVLLIASFFGKEDPALTSKLATELPGILNWAIKGYRRLRARGYFVQPASATNAIDDIETLAAPVKAFIRDCCKIAPGRHIKVDDLWSEWQEWCNREGRSDAGTKTWFGRNLQTAIPGLGKKRLGGSDDREWSYIGIYVPSPYERF